MAFLLDSHGLPLPSRIEASFRRQVTALPPDTQRLLLVAAAEPIGDPASLWGALARLGLPVEAAAPAEAAGLLTIGARNTFRHPLLRSAVYRAASQPDRRAAHAALAEVTDPELDPDRRVWHRAQATAGPDESVAEELERAAGRAQLRGGVPAAAAFLERATALTLDPRRRAARALATAQAKQEAGAFDEAVDFLGIAESSGALDALGQARAALVRAQITSIAMNVADAVPLLLDAAERLKPLDPALARETLRDAFHAAFGAGQRDSTREIAAAVRTAPPARTPSAPSNLLLDAMAAMFGESPAAGAPLARAALSAFRTEEISIRDGLA